MSLAGMGVVAIWHDLAPEAKDEFYEWHNREHMPERVGIPGFRRGRQESSRASTAVAMDDRRRGARRASTPLPPVSGR